MTAAIPAPTRGNHADAPTGNKTCRAASARYYRELFVDMGRPAQKQHYTLQQVQAFNTAGTLANTFKRYIEESKKPGSRAIGISRMYAYQAIMRSALALKMVVDITAMDYIDFAKARRAEGVSACTVNHDISHIHVVLTEAVDVWEMFPSSVLDVWRKAKKKLMKDGIVGKARVRTQRHEPAWQAAMLAYFAAQNEGRYSKTDMVDVYTFALYSARRISETCRLTVGDVDLETRLYWVRDLKNPMGKGFHRQSILLGPAYDIVKRCIEAMGPNPHPEARIFPYNPKTCSQRFGMGKNACGIFVKDFNLHGARRECASRMFEQGFSVAEVQMVTLHFQAEILLTNYTSLKPQDLLLGPASKRVAGAQPATQEEREKYMQSMDNAEPAEALAA